MGARKERLIHLLLRERLGGHTPPDLSRNILGAMDSAAEGRPAPQRSLPLAPKPLSLWMAVAAAIAVVAALTLGASAWLLNREIPSGQTPTAVEPNVVPSQQERANTPDVPDDREPIKRLDNPPPRPDPQRPDHDPDHDMGAPEPVKPEPSGPTLPDRVPDDTVETPEQDPDPEPVPDTPDDTVKTPTPPKPEPERPPTGSDAPAQPVKLGSVLYVADKGKLTYRLGAEDKWQDWVPGNPVLSGMQLKVKKPAAIELPDGARFYFDGEVTVRGDEKSLDVEVTDEQVYFDVYGSARDFTVRRNDAVLAFRDAEVLAARSGLRLQVTCLGGEIAVGDVVLKAGWSASLSDKGLSREKFEGARARYNPLVAGMDSAFVLMREELNDDARDRVYQGNLKDGVVTGSGREAAFGVELREDVAVRERGFVRLRVRVTGSPDGLSIGFGSDEESDWRYFQSHHEKVPNGEWTILRVPLSVLQDDGKKKGIWTGVRLRKFQIVLWTKENSRVEVDWFELGVDPEWNIKEEK
ncbi:MAG: hypothetical protein K8I27_16900 [Planctomycetes bacterium]|nr:hypothetical protein [Planctomycetota bacterium]